MLNKAIIAGISIVKKEVRKLWADNKGEMLGTIGWMAVIASVIVLAYLAITGWLPTFIGNIFAKMETLL